MKQPLPFNDFHECPHCHGEAIYDDLTDEEEPFTTRCKECFKAIRVIPIAHIIHSVEVVK